MASILTYNQVIDLLIDITKRHEQVNTFFLGRNWETENSEDILFPLFQVYPDFGKLTANSFNEYKTQTIRFVCKMLDLTTNGEENKRDVHSDTLRYAQDIVNEFNQHPFYMRSNIKLIGDVDFNEVLQEYQDDVTAGWSFNLTFQLININQFCGMPIQDIPGYAATGPESTGTIVNVQYLTCATLPNCPTIELIEDTLVDLQEQIDNLPPSALTLAQVLGYGNSTNNISITAGSNLSNILQVSDTVMGLSWNDTNNGSVILNNSFIKLAHDTFVTIDTIQTLILGEFHHILTDVSSISRIDTVAGSVLLSVERTSDGNDNQVYVEQYLTGIAASDISGIVSKLEIHTTQQSLLSGDPSTNNTMIITDAISNKGLVYVTDYSANFTDNSLVTKAWVLAQTPAAPSLQTVINVSSVINGYLAQSLNGLADISITDNYVQVNVNDGTNSAQHTVQATNITTTVNGTGSVITDGNIDFATPSLTKNGVEIATENFVDNRVQSNIKIIGDWDATSGSYPLADESNTTPFITQWGATIKAGWAFRVGYGQAGTVDGFDYENGDVVYALVDNPTDNSSDWGDLDHNLQQANESLRGTAKIVTAVIVADETSTDDERIVTAKKLWLNFWTRVLAMAHTFAAKITFSTAPRFSSVTASEYLKVDGNKDLSSVSSIPAPDVTEDSTHRFITDVERLKWNKFSYTDTVLGTATSGAGNQFSKSVLIPANTVSNGALNIKGRAVKSGSASFGWLNIYINTTNNLSGSPKHLGQINSSGGNTLVNFAIDRTIPIQAGSFVTFIVNTTNGFEEIVTNQASTATIDWTVDQYVILSCQCNGGVDVMRANFLSVVQH